MKFAYGVLAAKSIINQRTEQLSIIDIIDQVQVDSLPAAVPGVSIVTFWAREDDEDGAVELKIRMKRDPELPPELIETTGYVGPEFEQLVPAEAMTARTILEASAVLVATEGINKFVFEQEINGQWQNAGTVRINVQVGVNPSEIARSPASVSDN